MSSDVVEQLAAALDPAERHETHGSWVLVTADRAYKVKKPVVMPFLDYGTLERRRAMCRAEVQVNQRAAPGVYLGVRAVVRAGAGVALAPEDALDALEYAVEMRRFDDHRTLAALIARDQVEPEDVTRVGRTLAAFHAASAEVTESAGAEPVERTVDDDFASLGTLLGADARAQARLVAARRFSAAFLGARREQLKARAAAGRVRDGHGDLRAEHVLLPGTRIELVDAIEFDPALRRIDVGMDLAFLVMDLHLAGRPDLAALLVRAYRAAGGDPGDDALIAFFAAYRAQVRAKVALLRAAQLEPAAAAQARREASALLALADRLAWVARGPVLLVVAGVSASGKTTLASALADASGMEHLSSDVVRKRLVGVEPTRRAPVDAYANVMTDRTYAELGRLAQGDGVVVDASFHRHCERAAFLAALTGVPDAVFVECRAPRAVIESRAGARLADPWRTSDATPEIALRQLSDWEPLDEVDPRSHVIVRSDQDVPALVAEVADALDRRLSGPPKD